jgi:hypothetical protein
VILVKGTDWIHNYTPAKVDQRVKGKIQRCKFDVDFATAFFKFNLGKEFYATMNRRSNKQRKPGKSEAVAFAYAVGSKIAIIGLYVAAHNGGQFSNAQERPVVNGVHVHGLPKRSVAWRSDKKGAVALRERLNGETTHHQQGT